MKEKLLETKELKKLKIIYCKYRIQWLVNMKEAKDQLLKMGSIKLNKLNLNHLQLLLSLTISIQNTTIFKIKRNRQI
jgi:hypothetical protein